MRSRVTVPIIEGPKQHRLSLIPGPTFATNFDDHQIQELNGLGPRHVVRIIAELYTDDYTRITEDTTALHVPVDSLIERYRNLACAGAEKRKAASPEEAEAEVRSVRQRL